MIEDAEHRGPIKNGFATRFFYQRLNPDYRAITDITSETNASYQAAVVRPVHRLSGGLSVNVGYTYSHAIDDNQNESTFADNNDVYDPTDLRLEHGTSKFDVRERASGSIVARTTWRLHGLAGAALNGYSLGTSGEWRTGLPYSMRTTGDTPAPSCSYQEYLEYGIACVGEQPIRCHFWRSKFRRAHKRPGREPQWIWRKRHSAPGGTKYVSLPGCRQHGCEGLETDAHL